MVGGFFVIMQGYQQQHDGQEYLKRCPSPKTRCCRKAGGKGLNLSPQPQYFLDLRLQGNCLLKLSAKKKRKHTINYICWNKMDDCFVPSVQDTVQRCYEQTLLFFSLDRIHYYCTKTSDGCMACFLQFVFRLQDVVPRFGNQPVKPGQKMNTKNEALTQTVLLHVFCFEV